MDDNLNLRTSAIQYRKLVSGKASMMLFDMSTMTRYVSLVLASGVAYKDRGTSRRPWLLRSSRSRPRARMLD